MRKVFGVGMALFLCLAFLFSMPVSAFGAEYLDYYVNGWIYDDGKTLTLELEMLEGRAQEGWNFDGENTKIDVYVDGDISNKKEMLVRLEENGTKLIATLDMEGAGIGHGQFLDLGIGVIIQKFGDKFVFSNLENSRYMVGDGEPGVVSAYEGDITENMANFLNEFSEAQCLSYDPTMYCMFQETFYLDGEASEGFLQVYTTTESAIFVEVNDQPVYPVDVRELMEYSSDGVASAFYITDYLNEGENIVEIQLCPPAVLYSADGAEVEDVSSAGCLYGIIITDKVVLETEYLYYTTTYELPTTLELTATPSNLKVNHPVDYKVVVTYDAYEGPWEFTASDYVPWVERFEITENPELYGHYTDFYGSETFEFTTSYDTVGRKVYTVTLNGYYFDGGYDLYSESDSQYDEYGTWTIGKIKDFELEPGYIVSFREFLPITKSIEVDVSEDTTTEPSRPRREKDPVDYNLEIIIEGEGSVLPGEGTHSRDSGTIQIIKVNPAEGYEFVGWFGKNGDEVEVSGEIYKLLINGDKSITARFEKIAPEEPVIEESSVPEPELEPEPEPEPEIVLDEPIPADAPTLPQTAGIPLAVPLLIGGALTATGLIIRKKK